MLAQEAAMSNTTIDTPNVVAGVYGAGTPSIPGRLPAAHRGVAGFRAARPNR